MIEYEFSAPCDRCGIDAVHSHTVSVDKLLATAIERQESDTIITVPDMKFDVDEFVYSEVILDLPVSIYAKRLVRVFVVSAAKI